MSLYNSRQCKKLSRNDAESLIRIKLDRQLDTLFREREREKESERKNDTWVDSGLCVAFDLQDGLADNLLLR